MNLSLRTMITSETSDMSFKWSNVFVRFTSSHANWTNVTVLPLNQWVEFDCVGIELKFLYNWYGFNSCSDHVEKNLKYENQGLVLSAFNESCLFCVKSITTWCSIRSYIEPNFQERPEERTCNDGRAEIFLDNWCQKTWISKLKPDAGSGRRNGTCFLLSMFSASTGFLGLPLRENRSETEREMIEFFFFFFSSAVALFAPSRISNLYELFLLCVSSYFPSPGSWKLLMLTVLWFFGAWFFRSSLKRFSVGPKDQFTFQFFVQILPQFSH